MRETENIGYTLLSFDLEKKDALLRDLLHALTKIRDAKHKSVDNQKEGK